jgi:hypothetical protein
MIDPNQRTTSSPKGSPSGAITQPTGAGPSTSTSPQGLTASTGASTTSGSSASSTAGQLPPFLRSCGLPDFQGSFADTAPTGLQEASVRAGRPAVGDEVFESVRHAWRKPVPSQAVHVAPPHEQMGEEDIYDCLESFEEFDPPVTMDRLCRALMSKWEDDGLYD